jgi:hypothetical protein
MVYEVSVCLACSLYTWVSYERGDVCSNAPQFWGVLSVLVRLLLAGWGGGVEGLDGVGEDVEVVRGLGGGVGAEDGAAAGCEGEGGGAANAFYCAAGRVLGIAEV